MIDFIILFLASLVTSYFFGPFYLRWLRTKQYGQFIREEGPEAHKKKSGTPTMGAGIFLLPTLIIVMLFTREVNPHLLFLLGLLVVFGLIGFIDDYAKITKKQNEGLSSKQKFLLQLVGAVTLYFVFLHGSISTTIAIPLLHQGIEMGWLYIVFVVLMIIGASNATNLTDGIDGLLAGNAIVTFVAFAAVAYQVGNDSVLLLAIVLIATLLVFLMFNYNPAKVFMGDTGSLALGAIMAGMAVVLKMEILLLFIGAIYVIETLSVILQVGSFKLRGKRIFKMTPIHHHFELSGYDEKGLFKLFVIIQILCSIIGLIVYNSYNSFDFIAQIFH